MLVSFLTEVFSFIGYGINRYYGRFEFFSRTDFVEMTSVFNVYFSILYQRGIYPPENFKREQKYGLTLLVTDDEELKGYISNVLKQVKGL